MASAKAIALMESIYARVDKQVRDIMATLPGVTVPAQQDGSVISAQRRIYNYQGDGVTVVDDPARNRVNVIIPGAPTATAAQVVQSAAGTGRAFPLGAEPGGWQAVAFDDSGWSVSVADGQARTVPSQWVTESTGDKANSATFLLRHTFTLQDGTPTLATLEIDEDNILTVWLNGTQIHSFANTPDAVGYPFPMQTLTLPIALLLPGVSNTLAFKVQNAVTFTPPGPYAVGYRLTVNSTSAGLDDRYQLLSEKDQADGYAGLDVDGLVADAALADSGTPSSTTFLRGDRSWSAASTNSVTIQDIDGTPTVTATVLEFPNGTLSDQGGGVARYTAAAPGTVPYVNVQDQKTTGTNGGTFTSAAWRTRTLTTIQSDSDAIASLATNQITLPAGTYECWIRCPASEVDYHQARLQNITDTATILSGSSEYTQASVVVMNHSVIAGRFTLAASKALEVQHRCHTTRSGQGFGVAAGASFTVATEVYTIAEFRKVA